MRRALSLDAPFMLTLALVAVAVQAQPSPVEIAPLTFWAEETERFDHFGSDTALAESLLVVGADGADAPGVDGGAVYAFRYTGSGSIAGWEEEARLKPAAPFEQSTNLGWAVTALHADDEAFVLAGAPNESASMLQSEIRTGAAYVFRRTGVPTPWAREAKLIPEDLEAFDRTGLAVALAANAAGDSVFAAAWCGTAVHLWRREPEGGPDGEPEWAAEQVLDVGYALLPTTSSNSALAGSPPGPVSAARGPALLIGRALWRRTGADPEAPWVVEAVFEGSDPDDLPLGGARALDSDLVLLGAARVTAQGGAAYLFRYTGTGPMGGWTEEARFPSPMPETFGFGTGGALWAGADGAGGTGALAVVSSNGGAELYRNEGSSEVPAWRWAAHLPRPAGELFSDEAFAVGMPAGGREVVVGGWSVDDERGSQAGAGYLFDLAALPPVASELGTPERQDGPSLSVYPSPVRAGQPMQVRYSLASAGPVRLSVLDVLGRRVAVLTDEPRAPGKHTASWSVPASLPVGLYVVRLVAGGASVTRKLVVVR